MRCFGEELEGAKGPRLARTSSHLNIIRMYVTWSIPVPFTYSVSSSVAEMNNRPPATRNYTAYINTCISSNRREWGLGQLTKGGRCLNALNGENPLLVGVARGATSLTSSPQGLGVVSLCATKHTSMIRVSPAAAKV